MSSGSLTTTNASDLLFSAGASAGDVTAGGSGYTTRTTTYGNRTQDRNVTSAGAYSAAMTQNSNSWVTHLIAFRAAGSPPPLAALTSMTAGAAKAAASAKAVS